MTIQIGAKRLATRRPQDLDAVLLVDFGCNAAEIAGMLAGQPLAGTVARALVPFLAEGDRPTLAELASDIDAAGTVNVATQVAALYVAAGADDLDGLGGRELAEKAEAEEVSLAGAKTLDDKRNLIRQARLAKLAAAAEAGA